MVPGSGFGMTLEVTKHLTFTDAVNIAVNMASFIDDLVQHSDKPK